MSKPFNYLQYEGTGQGAFIAPYVTQFTGFYFPQDLEQGKAVGFVWRLFDDDLLRPAKIQIRITGQVPADNVHVQNMSFIFSGGQFPNYQDSGDYIFDFTGKVVTGDYEFCNFDIPFSGAQSGTNQDLQTNEINLSGSFPVTLNDAATFDPKFTGFYGQGNNLSYDYSVVFRGNFNKKNKDTSAIDVVFSQVSYNPGTSRVNIEVSSDEADINLIFSSVTFKQA